MKEIKVSAEFKTQTTKAIIAISYFIFTYLLMLVFAIGLTVLCVYAGIMFMVSMPGIITLALGIGLASLGILVLFFLLKFIFKSHKIDRSHLTEIKKNDEPKLFKLIEDLVNEVETNFPKKVYISSEVNASVFYDSSFWSMFFPLKKNLHIGLGLVNSVSKSELKAILSHEFGHFSQKTMKVGSYVYNVNQIIYNLLFDNEKYDNLIQKWANISGYFSIFVVIAVTIIDGIKWILNQMYGLVNKSYMALSREMEFHADEIAANITGYEPLKSSLLRMSLVDHSYNSVLSFYDSKISENKKSENLFRDHLFVTNFLAKDNNLEIKHNLPQISVNDLNKFNKSKLVIKDQWASHPSTEDRIAILEKTGLVAKSIDNESANLLFSDIEKIQKEITYKVFKNIVFTQESSSIPFESFQSNFKEEFEKNTFPKLYNGYYDNKNPSFFEIQSIEQDIEKIELEDLFSESNVEIVYTALSLQADIETIKQISNKIFDVKTFDYDGIKYTIKECNSLLTKLEKEIDILNEKIKLNDIQIFKYFKNQEQKTNLNQNLENLYNQFFNFDKEFETKYDVFIQLSKELEFINYKTTFEKINANFLKIDPLEAKLKKGIRELLVNPDYQTELTKDIKDNFEIYLTKKWEYFGDNKYFDNNLEKLFKAMDHYSYLLSRGYFLTKQKLLNYKVTLINTSKNM
ncbi:M48 family metalloprotease [Polaribacter sp. BAL334]|uniref:M48 family metalloprotease n=1 Tax=Polaribacter sp. BAL334 TaxID=1708178 RepID=UPI0018D1FAE0|nr:M48 family metalloprotease [Polaribacter sp. BAL334]MBG7612381.1 M48 family metalloprotease [Polaribacter sp. BAL334]